MKIAMLGSKGIPYMGSIQNSVEQLSARLVQRQHHVVYWWWQYVSGLSPYRGMKRCYSWGLRGKHLDAPTHTLTAALTARADCFDIIHIHGFVQSFVLPLIRDTGSAETVVTVHALDHHRSKCNQPSLWRMHPALRAKKVVQSS